MDCAKARAYAANILSQLAASAGDDETALTEMRRSAQDIERAFGAAHEETAMALMSLAMVARNAGHLIEAGDAMRRAAAIAQGLQLRAENRAEIERSMAVIDLDLGRYAEARDRLLAMIRADDRGRMSARCCIDFSQRCTSSSVTPRRR